MSEKRTIIKLEAPERSHTEGFVDGGHKCRYCNGRGAFMRSSPDGDREIECPDCKGTGELMAVVTVEWKPDNKPDNG